MQQPFPGITMNKFWNLSVLSFSFFCIYFFFWILLVHFWLLFFLFLEVNFWLIYIIISHLAMYRLHLWILTWGTTLLVSHRFFKNYLLIYGCAESLLLLRHFSSCSKWGPLSKCTGFSMQWLLLSRSIGSRACRL